ncbi:MAG TPA: CPBP family glutamic-type intramembrane protease [Pyrinomonadaceae bacterium]|nr:CPBP family glutamic-type intramembrane protease [Pyrinomonadaceae bacterium]
MKSVSTRLFAILWVAGMLGVLSILLIDLSALMASLPATAGSELPFPPLIIKLIGIIQPTILLAVAVFVGVRLAPAVGLSAPAAEALARRENPASAITPQIIPGLVSGVLGAIALLATWILLKPFLPPLFVSRAEKFNTTMPALTRLLYGGITEELLLRWGLLTLIVWASWRWLHKGGGKPPATYFVMAIVLSSLVFGVGHLPIVRALGVDFTLPIVGFIVLGNTLFGLIAGLLYWLKGLEAAIIAHMTVHIVIISAIHFLM